MNIKFFSLLDETYFLKMRWVRGIKHVGITKTGSLDHWIETHRL